MIIETHIHICDSRYDEDREEMLNRARAAGITKFINIGAELKESRKVVDYSSDGVYGAIGLHPHYIEELNDEVFEEFKGYFSGDKNLVALGEVGLDYFKSPTPRDVQIAGFRRLMPLAVEFDLPVLIHSRDAHEDVYDILKEFDVKKSGIIHCYTAGIEAAQKFIDLGYYIGIGGVLTFPNAGDLMETVRKIPLDKIVLETDAPWLAPQNVRGQRNEAAFIKYVAEKVAEVKAVSVEEVENVTTENACKVFGL